VLQILEALDIEREMVATALDAYLSTVSNRLNRTMQTLTVLTITIGVIGSVFGAWGMNVEGIPLHDVPHAFSILIVATITLLAGLLFVARKLKWL